LAVVPKNYSFSYINSKAGKTRLFGCLSLLFPTVGLQGFLFLNNGPVRPALFAYLILFVQRDPAMINFTQITLLWF
jgi:hypothetical protein